MYKNSKHTVLFPLLLAAGVVLGLVLGQYLGRNTTTSQLKGMLSRMALPDNKLSYTLSLIENQYVDSVSMDSLAEHVIPMLVKELEKALKKYISEQCGKIAPEGYYNSLIRRYSRSLFEILISTPFGNIARYKKFDDDRRNFYSISLFTDEENPQIQPDKQSMHYQILFHQQINSNTKLNSSAKNKTC